MPVALCIRRALECGSSLPLWLRQSVSASVKAVFFWWFAAEHCGLRRWRNAVEVRRRAAVCGRHSRPDERRFPAKGGGWRARPVRRGQSGSKLPHSQNAPQGGATPSKCAGELLCAAGALVRRSSLFPRKETTRAHGLFGAAKAVASSQVSLIPLIPWSRQAGPPHPFPPLAVPYLTTSSTKSLNVFHESGCR